MEVSFLDVFMQALVHQHPRLEGTPKLTWIDFLLIDHGYASRETCER
jgi:hypothetical protein